MALPQETYNDMAYTWALKCIINHDVGGYVLYWYLDSLGYEPGPLEGNVSTEPLCLPSLEHSSTSSRSMGASVTRPRSLWQNPNVQEKQQGSEPFYNKGSKSILCICHDTDPFVSKNGS